MSRRMLVVVGVAAAALTLAAVAIAITGYTDVQANSPQVAGQPTSDDTAHFPTNKQNEPSVAVNSLNSAYLVAGSNDEQLQPECGPGPVRGADAEESDCSFFPDVGTDGIYTSSDGGATWTNQGLLPGFSDDGGKLVSDGDPVLVYGPAPDANGSFATARATHSWANGTRTYYASLASYASGAARGNQAPELLTVSTSDANPSVRTSWSDPVIAAKGNGYRFNDKEAVYADDSPTSPYFGRVYLSWTQFRDIPSAAEPVTVSYSDDGGKTWTRPNQLSAAHNNAAVGGRQGSAITTAPDGTAYVVWEDGDRGGSNQVVSVSTDGGRTWSHPIRIASFTDIEDPIPGANFRTSSFASVASAANGDIWVAWAGLVGGTGKVLVYKGTNKGQTWALQATLGVANRYAFFQGLDVAPNGRVDAGFQALSATDSSTYGTDNATIDSYYANSTNWSSVSDVSSASSDPAASAQNNLERQFWGDYNTLVSTNAQAWFIYTDSRGGVGCPTVDAYQHFIDGSSETEVDKPAPLSDCPDSASAEFGNTDVYVSKITP